MPASSTSRRSVISPHWPRTSGRRSALDEVARLGAQRLLARGQRFELCADVAVRLAARLVELVHLPLGTRQCVADRRDETVDGLLARREIAFGTLGLHAQGLARELQESLRVILELPVRELIERRAEPFGRERQYALALDVGRRHERAARRP